MSCVLNYSRHRVLSGAVYIGRAMSRYGLPASKCANRFRVRRNATHEERVEVIAQYERHLVGRGLIHDVHELRGKDLVCWCAPDLCHGDVLLRLANA
jgi:hypothetical protein